MPLNDIRQDEDLMSLVADVNGGILLLEDIDVFHAATIRDDEAKTTLSGLLNALDGVATPPSLVTIMTTNNPDILDEALVRPGRVDRHERFGFADSDQLTRLFFYCYRTSPTSTFDVQKDVTLAQVSEIFKHNFGDPPKAEAELHGLIR
jgi:ATP-dependent 26S proteasome regulatory subunit